VQEPLRAAGLAAAVRAVGGLQHSPLRRLAQDRLRFNSVLDRLHRQIKRLDEQLEDAAGQESIQHVDAALGFVDDAVRSTVGSPVWQEVDPWCPRKWHLPGSGQFQVGRPCGPCATSFLRQVCGLRLSPRSWDLARAHEQIARAACCWYPHQGFILACEHPREIHLEPIPAGRSGLTGSQRQHRLHRGSGPAAVWEDGWGVYAVHGCVVPGWIIEHPGTISVRDIEAQANAEVRRVMLDSFGWARYIADSHAVIVDQVPVDHVIHGLRGARLLRKELPGEPEPLVYLEMLNSTPEPDGTFRRYLERIDPKAYGGDAGRLCHAAMASRWHSRDDAGRLVRTFES
jgi:hypothetical protein